MADKYPDGLHFFAAANGKDGFVSYFDKVFGQDTERLYILIGGPGCGKSTLLKKVAAISEEKGYITEHIHCSSSPESLDGVIIRDKKIAVIDGTPPHMYSPKAPGAREIHVDLGRAWNTDELCTKIDDIKRLSNLKASRYKRAYIYIGAANILKKQAHELAEGCVFYDKLTKSVNRAYQKLGLKENKQSRMPKIRLQRAVSGMGNVYFNSFYNMAKETVFIDDYYGTGYMYLEKLSELAQKNGNTVTVSYDPEDAQRIDGIYFEECGIAFTVFAKEAETVVNCSRFADKTRIREIKERYGFAVKTADSLMLEAYSALKDATGFHDEIEKIYKDFTDFSVTEKISENLCDDIFGK